MACSERLVRNRWILATLVVIAGCFRTEAQRASGYIVLNSGDTLKGEIKKPSALYMLHHEVTFLPAGERDEYKFFPEELHAFAVGEQVFESRYIWSGKKLVRKFLQVLVRGYCTLFEYRFAERNQRGMVGPPQQRFYAMRNTDRLHELDFSKLKKGRDNYFADDPSLMADLQAHKYDKKDLPAVVERYNREAIKN
jgi:hypothetical protein